MSDQEKSLRKNCPICGVSSVYMYDIKDTDKVQSLWYKCRCGIVFQSEPPEKLDLKKIEEGDLDPLLGVDLVRVHTAQMYAPLIEDCTLNREMISVGFSDSPDTLKFFNDRGWLVYGIDDTDCFTPGGGMYKGKFEDADFKIKVDEKTQKDLGEFEPIDRKFDLIWISHYLQRSDRPLDVLKKAANVLDEGGVLFIDVPDPSFIYLRGVSAWPHWRKYCYTFWTKEALVKELEKLGFEIIVTRRNFASRCGYYDDLQVLAHKRYF